MSIYLSGIQPTGKFHLGNYLGCIKPFLSLTTKSKNSLSVGGMKKNIFLIADMHCFTKPEKIKITGIKDQIREAVRSLIAIGICPETTDIVQQSKILEHANLAWYLSCLAKFSRIENMTQFKTNSLNNPNTGLFMYPILQASDVLLYKPDYVLVGPDQQQHLELTAELCDKANQFTGIPIFKKPKILSNNLRIKNLKDETKKMSKSEPEGCLFLKDDSETIYRKIMGAKTDSISGINYDKTDRKALANLIEIRASLQSSPNFDFSSSKGHREFKEELAGEIEKYFNEFRGRCENISDGEVDEILFEGTKNVSKLAADTLKEFLKTINK